MQGTLTVKDVTIHLASGGTFSAIINAAGKCSIIADSGAGFRGQVNAKELTADVTAGAYARLWGGADTAKIYCSGGSLNAEKFVCKSAGVWAQKASAVSIYTSDYIKTDTDASSSITYYGNPAKTSLGVNTYAIKRDNFKLSLK